ncbi:MAG: PilT/PilU family type 4a pilus ATPase [Gammaproteobacteria bacterium]|nr:PilT/PilU family type 4a pilus ATPase [Gammaproteobacteria bacterium]
MKVTPYLKVLAEKGGSDLYFSTGAKPSAKFNGVLTSLGKDPAPPGWIDTLAQEMMNDKQRVEFDSTHEMNLAMSVANMGRFRVNIFKQRNETSMVIRNIVAEIPNANDLGLPEVLKEVIMVKRGLILFVGGTGSGKSTSLAALIDYRNTNSKGHIITIEDPVEYVHQHKGCIVNQREIGMDTDSFAAALKNTLRQAPDVILIGEIRDRETMEHAMAFAETGHLAISTLHANNANQALDRIINFFPEERRPQLLNDLSNNLQAFVSQRLIPTVDGKRCAAIEVLLNSSRIKDLILKGDIQEIKEVMAKSEASGMRTFDAALYYLYNEGKITLEEALKNADAENNLRLRIDLAKKGDETSQEESVFDGLSLLGDEQEEEDKSAPQGKAVFKLSDDEVEENK